MSPIFLSLSVSHYLVMVAAGGILIWAALSDFRAFVIPNRLVLGMLALYPLHLLTAAAVPDYWGALMVAVALFVGGAGLFAARLIGGGDVKLLAALGLWAGPMLALPLLMITSVAGGLYALALLTPLGAARLGMSGAQVPLNGKPGGSARRAQQPMPYGVAIAAGGLYVMARVLVAG